MAKFAYHNLQPQSLLSSGWNEIHCCPAKTVHAEIMYAEVVLAETEAGEMDFAILCMQMQLLKSEIKNLKPDTRNLAETETGETDSVMLCRPMQLLKSET